MDPGGLPARRGMLAGAAVVAAPAGGLVTVALGGGNAAALAVGAVLAAAVASGCLWLALMLYDLREQQRRIIAQLELQGRILYNAARLVEEPADDPKR